MSVKSAAMAVTSILYVNTDAAWENADKEFWNFILVRSPIHMEKSYPLVSVNYLIIFNYYT